MNAPADPRRVFHPGLDRDALVRIVRAVDRERDDVVLDSLGSNLSWAKTCYRVSCGTQGRSVR